MAQEIEIVERPRMIRIDRGTSKTPRFSWVVANGAVTTEPKETPDDAWRAWENDEIAPVPW